MTSVKSLINAAVAVTIVIVIAALPALAVVHATEGVITRVDSTAKKIVVRTADGTEEIFKFTGKTAVRGAKVAKSGAVDSYFAGREGAHVVVRYTGEAGDKSAVAVDDFGKDTMKVGKGAITGADKAGHTVTVKTEDGSEETYHVAKDAAVDSEHGVVQGTEYAAKKGQKVTVHYTEEAGKKVAHFIKHM